MFSFGKVGGGTPTQPIPVTFPNTIGAYPGQQVELWYYNEAPDGTAPNQWEMFGHGTVSNDGKLIVSNPGVGIPRFCCGAGFPRRPLPPPNNPPPENAPEKRPDDCECGDPVDLATGILSMRSTDFHIEGQVPLALQRTYRTLDPTVGPFGVGGRHNYEFFVRAVSPDMALLLTPENQRPRFARQADGSLVNTDRPQLRGARLTQDADENWRLRFKEGAEWRFTYAGSGVTIQQVTDPLGRILQYTYDAAGRLIAVTDPAGGITRYAYDTQGRLQSWTDPRGTVRAQNSYDPAGRLIEQVQADGGLWRLVYTVVAGTVVQTTETDPEGRMSVYRFGPSGFPHGVQDGQGQVATTQRQAGTNLVQGTTDPLGRTTSYTYDTLGNATSRTDALGTTTYQFDPVLSKPIQVTDPLGNVLTLEYDPQANLVAITEPVENLKPPAERLKTTFLYDAQGRVQSRRDPLGAITQYEYDSPGNLTAVVDPLGNRTQYGYDIVSRLINLRDASGRTTRFAYDALDRRIQVTDALGQTTQATYDANGNLTGVTDSLGRVTTQEFDAMDRLIRRADPLGRVTTFTYDRRGHLISMTDAKGQTTTHIYDAQGRRIRSSFADGTSVEAVYDAADRLLAIRDSEAGTIEFTYDALDRLVEERSDAGVVSYRYDGLGRRTQMIVNGQAPVEYAYDASSQVAAISQPPVGTVYLTYDARHQRSDVTLPNQVHMRYAYNGVE